MDGSATCSITPMRPPELGGSMGLKRQTKRHQNNTPICFAHLDKCNGIVLACWRSTLPRYGAGKSPVFSPPHCSCVRARFLPTVAALSAAPPGAVLKIEMLAQRHARCQNGLPLGRRSCDGARATSSVSIVATLAPHDRRSLVKSLHEVLQ